MGSVWKAIRHGSLIAGIIAATLPAAQAERINTADVISRTMSGFSSCASYSVVGACTWWRLKCGFFGCKIKLTTTLRAEHYVPELTFQTYKNAEKTPWVETGAILSAIVSDYDSSVLMTLVETAYGIDVQEFGGGDDNRRVQDQHDNVVFNLVDAFGNPTGSNMALLSSLTGGFVSVCQAQTTSMYPYFVSNQDWITWRWGYPELLAYPVESANIFDNNLGDLDDNWGAIFPRIGHATSHDALKDSALMAFRAGHVVTRSGEPHVYTPYIPTRNKKQGIISVPTGGVETNKGKWQQIAPHTENGCSYFPRETSTFSPDDGKAAFRSDDGGSVWNLWREYSCCTKPGGYKYLFHF